MHFCWKLLLECSQSKVFMKQLLLSFMTLLLTFSCADVKALESTMPPNYVENIVPEIGKLYSYAEKGQFATGSVLPVYEWMPSSGHLKAIILGVHGLTLHGRRYRILARTLAVNGIGFVSMDMRGFGSCKFDDSGREKPKDDLSSINHEKSYQDIVLLMKAIKSRYPQVPLIVLGESLGCTFCIRLAGEYPGTVNGVILSAPAVRVNPKMYASESDIAAGLKALIGNHHLVNLNGFFHDLVSPRPEVVQEMIEDPFIVKALSFHDLIATDGFVDKTAEWARGTASNLPMLVIQGSNDKCVLPKHLTDMMMNMKSNDMRIAWKGSYGHLQLETMFLRANIMDSIGMWLDDHSVDGRAKLERLEQNISDLGGALVR